MPMYILNPYSKTKSAKREQPNNRSLESENNNSSIINIGSQDDISLTGTVYAETLISAPTSSDTKPKTKSLSPITEYYVDLFSTIPNNKSSSYPATKAEPPATVVIGISTNNVFTSSPILNTSINNKNNSATMEKCFDHRSSSLPPQEMANVKLAIGNALINSLKSPPTYNAPVVSHHKGNGFNNGEITNLSKCYSIDAARGIPKLYITLDDDCGDVFDSSNALQER